MSEMNGQDLSNRVVALLPGIKVLYMSGYACNVLTDQGVLNGDVVLLQKPFSLQTLAKTVRKVLDGE